MENIERPGLQCSPIILIKGSVLQIKGYEGLRLGLFFGGGTFFCAEIFCGKHFVLLTYFVHHHLSTIQYISEKAVYKHSGYCVYSLHYEVLYRQVRQ